MKHLLSKPTKVRRSRGGGGMYYTGRSMFSVLDSFNRYSILTAVISYLLELILPVHNDNISLGI